MIATIAARNAACCPFPGKGTTSGWHGISGAAIAALMLFMNATTSGALLSFSGAASEGMLAAWMAFRSDRDSQIGVGCPISDFRNKSKPIGVFRSVSDADVGHGQRLRGRPSPAGTADFHTTDPLQREQMRSPNPSLWKMVLQRRQVRFVAISPAALLGVKISEWILVMVCAPCAWSAG